MSVSKSEIQKMIAEEIDAGGYPFPQALIESLVKVESSFKPGIVNNKSGASGLTQVMPGTLEDFNKRHSLKVSLDELRADSIPAARKQIQVGLWVLGQFWKGAYKYLQPRLGTVPVDELVKIADLFYVAGPGATKKKLEKVSTPNYETLLAVYPTWNAHPHVRKVWDYTAQANPIWNLNAIDEWVSDGSGGEPIVAGFGGHLGGFVLAALLVGAAWYFLKGKNDAE
jgi:hypothetical protein